MPYLCTYIHYLCFQVFTITTQWLHCVSILFNFVYSKSLFYTNWWSQYSQKERKTTIYNLLYIYLYSHKAPWFVGNVHNLLLVCHHFDRLSVNSGTWITQKTYYWCGIGSWKNVACRRLSISIDKIWTFTANLHDYFHNFRYSVKSTHTHTGRQMIIVFPLQLYFRVHRRFLV